MLRYSSNHWLRNSISSLRLYQPQPPPQRLQLVTTTTATSQLRTMAAHHTSTAVRPTVVGKPILANRVRMMGRSNVIMRQQQQQQRGMGGNSSLPKPQSEDAVLFGGHSTEPEGWETTIYVGYTLSLILCFCILYFEPETGIDNWANQEARVRLKLKEEHGWTDDMFQFGIHYQNLNEVELKQQWDKFSNKTLKMDEDDDDDDDDE
jgi:ESSS subunit of NADH:ubiquinone oxidoreductase (complex I)